MASNKVLIEISLTDKGTLKVTEKQAEKTAKSLEKTSVSARAAGNSMKGAGEVSSNSTKNFAKMSQGITSGLVPAYATLAANVFAVTAAFQFLRDSADISNLIAGQEALGAVTGVAFKTISNSVKEATAGQLAYQEAARGTAIGTAAGLSADQLTALGAAANNASLALGRDLTDSFNRLIKGVTKAEPELLDELGIILRLDDATKKYADRLGLAQDELTTFQRQQAVANEVLGQAEEKYGKIAEIIDPAGQSLNRFLSSFDSLANELQTTITKLLAPAFEFLSENISSLTALLSVFALSLSRAVLPALPDFKNLKEAAEDSENALRKAANTGSKTGKAIADGAKIGKKEIAILEKAINAKKSTVLLGSEAERRTLVRDLKIYEAQHDLVMARNTTGFRKYTLTVLSNLKLMQAESGKTLGAFKFLGAGLGKALNLIPIIGGIFLAIDLFKQLYEVLFPVNEELKKSNELAEALSSSSESVNKELNKQIEIRKRVVLSAKELVVATGNTIASAEAYNKVLALQAIPNEETEKYKTALQGVKDTLNLLSKIDPGFKVFSEELNKTGTLTNEAAEKLFKLEEALKNNAQAVKDFPAQLTSVSDKLKELSGIKVSPLRELQTLLEQAGKSGATALSSATDKIAQQKDEKQELIATLEEEASKLKTLEATYMKQGRGYGKKRDYEQQRKVVEGINQEIITKNSSIEVSKKELEAQKERNKELARQKTLFGEIFRIQTQGNQTIRNLEESSAKLRTKGVSIEEKRQNLLADQLVSISGVQQKFVDLSKAQAALDSAKTGTNKDLIDQAKEAVDAAESALNISIEDLRVKTEKTALEQKLLDIAETSLDLENQKAQIGAEKIAQKVLEYKKQALAVDNKILSAEKQAAQFRLSVIQNEQKLANFAKTGRLELNPKEEANAAIEQAKLELEFAVKEAELKKKSIEAETELQKSKLDILLLENKFSIQQNKLRLEEARLREVPEEKLAGLSNTIANLEALNYEQLITTQKQGLDKLAETQKNSVSAGVDAAVSNFELKFTEATINALKGGEIQQAFTSNLKSGLKDFFRGDKTIGEAIGGSIRAALELASDKALDTAIDMLIGGLDPQLIAINANTTALAVLTSALTGSSVTAGLSENRSGLLGAIGSGIKGLFSGITGLFPTGNAASIDAAAQGTSGLLGIPEAGTVFTTAMGGIYQGGISAFASGGIVTRPTIGLVGEAGQNEAVVPLPDGKAIPVNMNGTNNNNNVAVNINMATGQAETTGNDQQLAAFGNSIVDIVQREIADQTRPGGLLAR